MVRIKIREMEWRGHSKKDRVIFRRNRTAQSRSAWIRVKIRSEERKRGWPNTPLAEQHCCSHHIALDEMSSTFEYTDFGKEKVRERGQKVRWSKRQEAERRRVFNKAIITLLPSVLSHIYSQSRDNHKTENIPRTLTTKKPLQTSPWSSNFSTSKFSKG